MLNLIPTVGTRLVLLTALWCAIPGCAPDDSDGPDARLGGNDASMADASADASAPDCTLSDRFGPSTAELAAADLAPGTYADLAVCEGETDWFAIPAPVGQAVRVQVTADRSVAAALLGASGEVLAEARGRAPALRAIAPLRGLRLRVESEGQSTGYDLEISVFVPLLDCADDPAEAGDAVGGERFEGGVIRALCDGDEDRLQVPGAAGDAVSLRVVLIEGADVAVVWRQASASDGSIETHWGTAGAGRPWSGQRRQSGASTTLHLTGGPARYRVEAEVAAAPPERVERSVSGRVLTPDRVGTAAGNEPAPDRPAPGLPILLFAPDGTLVDAGRCAPDGRVTLSPWAEAEADLDRWSWLAVAALPGPAKVEVRSALGAEPWRVPLRAQDVARVAAGPEAAALHILTTLAEGVARVAALPPSAEVPRALEVDAPFASTDINLSEDAWPGVPPVIARWSPGQRPRCGACFVPVRSPYLALSGDPSDPDEWDDAVVLHELGHWVAAVLAHDDSPGGPHDGSPVPPALAWSEGLADFFAAWVLSTSTLYDDRDRGVRRVELDLGGEAPTEDPVPLDGLISEHKVAQLLWFLHTGALAGRDEDLWRPLFSGLPQVASGGQVDRGAAGVDLADWLAALACQGHAAAATTAAEALGFRFAAPEPPGCSR